MTQDPDTDVRLPKAEGRDVDLPEEQLDCQHETRTLRLTGTGSRKAVRAVDHILRLAEAARAIVAEQPGLTTTALGAALRAMDEPTQKGDESKGARLAEDRGWLRREKGKHGAWLHFPPLHTSTSPDVPRGDVQTHPDPP